MSILELGVTLSAMVFVLIAITTTALTLLSFIVAQTRFLIAAFTRYKDPHGSLHPFTQSLLDGSSPELKLAKTALKRGDKAEARRLTTEIIHLLNAESNDTIRQQLQSKLKAAL